MKHRDTSQRQHLVSLYGTSRRDWLRQRMACQSPVTSQGLRRAPPATFPGVGPAPSGRSFETVWKPVQVVNRAIPGRFCQRQNRSVFQSFTVSAQPHQTQQGQPRVGSGRSQLTADQSRGSAVGCRLKPGVWAFAVGCRSKAGGAGTTGGADTDGVAGGAGTAGGDARPVQLTRLVVQPE